VPGHVPLSQSRLHVPLQQWPGEENAPRWNVQVDVVVLVTGLQLVVLTLG
jgi:hypothetical protein